MIELSIWADAVVFRAVFTGNNLAILASSPDKYFIVLGDKVELWKRVFFFFAVRMAAIPLERLNYHTGNLIKETNE